MGGGGGVNGMLRGRKRGKGGFSGGRGKPIFDSARVADMKHE